MKQLVVQVTATIDGFHPGEVALWPDTARNRARLAQGKGVVLGELELADPTDVGDEG